MIAAGRHADDPRRLHVFLVLLDQRRAAHGARVLRPSSRCRSRRSARTARRCPVRSRGSDRARDAVDQQRDQDRRKRKLDVGDAHDEARRACRRHSRRPDPRLTPTHTARATEATPTSSEMRAPNMIADSTSRPWSSVPSRYSGSRAGHAMRRRQRVEQVQRREVERIVRRDPGREQRGGEADTQHERRDDRDRRAAEAVREIAVATSGRGDGGGDRFTHRAAPVLSRGRDARWPHPRRPLIT